MYFQLNTQSSYDFGSSTILPSSYASRAKELGYTGIALCDVSLSSFPSFSDACEANKIKGIFGHRLDLFSTHTIPFHACLYVKDEQGYRNLCKILSRKEEVCSKDTLSLYHEGLILVLACDSDLFFSDVFLTRISPDILFYKKLFQDDFYLGVCLYNESDFQEVHQLYQFIDDNEYSSVAFPYVCYLKKTDAYKKNVLEKALKKEPALDVEKEGPYFLLSEKVIQKIYREKEINASEEIAKKISFSFFEKRGELITFEKEDEILKKKCEEGLKRKLGEIPKEYQDRLSYELSVIQEMKFSSYFLLVSDYVHYAKTHDIKVGPGRGSAGGALTSFAMDITEIDPLSFHLSFERFLNPKRSSMPDIDIDFETRKRDDIIRYLKQKYGERHCSNIVTFERLKPKKGLQLIGEALSFNKNRLKQLSSLISPMAKNFKEALNDNYYGTELRKLYEDPYYKNLCDLVESLLDTPINTSIHPAGLIVSKNDIYQTCPVSEGMSGMVMYEYPYMERMGFLKVDILALDNLDFIREIENEIQKEGKKIPSYQENLNDPKVYDVLNALDTCNIFQLESYSMRRTIQQVHPVNFEQMAAVSALNRPGPKAYIPLYAKRKNGQEKIQYKHPVLQETLKESQGIMIYQEQIIQAVQLLAGFSLSDADLFRAAISKKKLDKMEKYKADFIKGCKEKNNIDEKLALEIYNDIEQFASYGYNKAHCFAYNMVTYQLLFLKTYFPKEFYSAVLKRTSLNKINSIETELKERNLKLKNPDINLSLPQDYLFQDGNIFIPFLKISNVQENFVDAIVEERKKGKYTSFYDFCQRNYDSIGNTEEKALRSMIDAGCFDSLCKSRVAMKEKLNDYLSFIRLSFPEDALPPLSDEGEDIGEMLYLEKICLGKVLSISLNRIFYRNHFITAFVSDTSMLEISHTIKVETEDNSYTVQLDKKEEVQKFDFVLIQADFSSKNKGRIVPYQMVNMKKKVVKHG